jgi:ornithine cyclodeaminase
VNRPIVLDEAAVRRRLDYDGCIAAMRAVMRDLSEDERQPPLRSISDLGGGRLFGLMPGMLPGAAEFGAKLLSVFEDPARPGRSAHRGVVVYFDGDSGEVTCVADAGAVTEIRTACATAVATDALARADARRLAIFGCGTQAESHVEALVRVRDFETVGVWGRDFGSAQRFAARMGERLGVAIGAVEDAEELADAGDVICTVTAASEPILLGRWVRPGTHVNAVGSSQAGPREVDSHLVAVSRYFVDYRRSALAAAAEFLAAREEGVVGDGHIIGEIGDVLAGRVAGRRSDTDITMYKSLGHVAQDLAAVRYMLARSDQGERI